MECLIINVNTIVIVHSFDAKHRQSLVLKILYLSGYLLRENQF